MYEQTYLTTESNEQDPKYKLLETLDNIEPIHLSKTSQSNYTKKLSQQIQHIIEKDGSNFILLVQAIKDCKKPCYKRDVLLEILKLFILSVRNLSLLLVKPFSSNTRIRPRKELANALVSVPDVVANCGVLASYPDLRSDTYYSKLLTVLYAVLLETTTKPQNDLSAGVSVGKSSQELTLFYSQLIGRIAISHCQLVWDKFTSQAMKEAGSNTSNGARLLLANIIESSSSSSSSSANSAALLHATTTTTTTTNAHLGMFIEPLIAPILYNFTPSDQDCLGGNLIKSIIGTSIFHNKVLEYILCNKYLLQTNYKQPRNRQLAILFNVFSYLSSLNCANQHQKEEESICADSSTTTSSLLEQPPLESQEKHRPENLLIKTLLAIGDSWSDRTKVLLRPYEQSRFITCAFIIGLRFALRHDKQNLAKCAHKLQASIIRGFPVYLNRASKEHRCLAMCLGEVVLAKLHQVMDEHHEHLITGSINGDSMGKPSQELKSGQRMELSFDVQWDSELLFMKNLLDCDIVSLFDERAEQVKKSSGEDETSAISRHHPLEGSCENKQGAATLSCVTTKSKDDDELIACVMSQLKQSSCNDDNHHREDASKSKIKHENAPIKTPLTSSAAKCLSSRKAVIELDEDGDDEKDLVPFESSDDESGSVDDNDEQDESAPIYLRDCIAGLAENKHPRYVRLCLIRLAALMESRNKELEISAKLPPKEKSWNERDAPGTAVNDVAVELAQLLLYLDDQYSIKDFEAYRMKALSGLCVASPDKAVKYLLDEFNGTTRSIRHQLDILQALVISAERLATASNPPITPISTTKATSTTTTTTTNTSGRIRDSGAGSTNGFVKYVSLYFYGIVHRLKADLSITILPSTIVSARAAAAGLQSNANSRQQTMIRRVIDSLTSSMSQIDRNLLFSSSRSFGGTATTTASATTSTTKTINHHTRQDSTPNPPAKPLLLLSSHATTTSPKRGTAPPVEQGKELEDHDNSYLLSRLLFSVSLLIKCVHQQPITCKLANDLLDILAAYRGHPDVGVRKAMASCLTVVKDCTPSVYFQEYLYDKTISLFGEWLSNESAQLTKLIGD